MFSSDAFEAAASDGESVFTVDVDLGAPVILTLGGELNFVSVRTLNDALDWLQQLEVERLLIDLSHVSYIDVAGATPLLCGGHPLLGREGTAQLVGGNRHLRTLARLLPDAVPGWLYEP